MKIFLDTNSFDFQRLQLKDYLKSIKENFPISEIFIEEKEFETYLIDEFKLKRRDIS